MRHSPLTMPVRTAALTALLDHVLHRPVESLSLQQIQRGRRRVFPAVPPFSWVSGPRHRGVAVTAEAATARDGHRIPLRVYRAAPGPDGGSELPVVMYFHGGGWVQGNVAMYDPLCTHLAHAVGAVVVSVDYRLAPEAKAPTAALDAIDATRWVAGHGPQLGADPGRLAVCGDSAGGNLAAVVAQAARDEGLRIAHQALVYPAVDLTLASPSIEEHAHAPMLTRRSILAFRAHYLPPAADPTDPLLSPLFGDLRGVAPALVQTADLDPLRDDGSRYAAALREAGVPVRLTNYLRVPHGFASYPGAVPVGARHRAELVTELRRHLAGAPGPHQPASAAGTSR